MSPPLREAADQEALWRGLAGGDLQVVATDHCPFTLADKARGRDDFSKIPNGAPGIETRMMLLWDGGVRAGQDRRAAVRRADGRRRRRGSSASGPRKGTIAVGSDADLVIWDPERETRLSVDDAPHARGLQPVRGAGRPRRPRRRDVARRGDRGPRGVEGPARPRAVPEAVPRRAAPGLEPKVRHRVEWRPPCASPAVLPPCPARSWPLPPRSSDAPDPREGGAPPGREWESRFLAIPSPDNMREAMRRLTARPHHVGSPYDKENAEWILAQFKEWGWDAQIETFDVLFPTPKERLRRDGRADAVRGRARRAGARGRPDLRPEGRAASDLQRLLDRRRRHRRRSSTSTTACPRTTSSSSGWASR